jgi:phage gp45-like
VIASRQQQRQLLLDFAAGLIRLSKVVSTSPDGYDQAEGRQHDPSEPETQGTTRRMQHYGLRSRAPAGSDQLLLAPGGASNQKICIATETPGLGPTDQVEGEVELYAKPGQRVRLDKDGNVRIDPKANQDTLVNGGGVNVAVVGSEVDCGSFSVTMAMGAVASVLWTPPGSVVSTVIATFPAATPITGKVTTGSAHFKAPAP